MGERIRYFHHPGDLKDSDVLFEKSPERARLSLGVLANLWVNDGAQRYLVLQLNKNRFHQGKVEYGLIGGASEFKDGKAGRDKFIAHFGLEPGQFENETDVRISKIPVNQVKDILYSLLTEYCDFPFNILNELDKELRTEMGNFGTENYTGLLPGRESVKYVHTGIFPPQISDRDTTTNNDSIRVLSLCDFQPTAELQAYILSHADKYDSSLNSVSQPFLLIPESEVFDLAKDFQQTQDEAIRLNGVNYQSAVLNETPVFLSGQLELYTHSLKSEHLVDVPREYIFSIAGDNFEIVHNFKKIYQFEQIFGTKAYLRFSLKRDFDNTVRQMKLAIRAATEYNKENQLSGEREIKPRFIWDIAGGIEYRADNIPSGDSQNPKNSVQIDLGEELIIGSAIEHFDEGAKMILAGKDFSRVPIGQEVFIAEDHVHGVVIANSGNKITVRIDYATEKGSYVVNSRKVVNMPGMRDPSAGPVSERDNKWLYDLLENADKLDKEKFTEEDRSAIISLLSSVALSFARNAKDVQTFSNWLDKFRIPKEVSVTAKIEGLEAVEGNNLEGIVTAEIDRPLKVWIATGDGRIQLGDMILAYMGKIADACRVHGVPVVLATNLMPSTLVENVGYGISLPEMGLIGYVLEHLPNIAGFLFSEEIIKGKNPVDRIIKWHQTVRHIKAYS